MVGDEKKLWDQIARTALDAFGDVAVVTRVVRNEGVIAVVAVCHRDPVRDESAQRVLGERFRRGQGIPGRVWESERGILLVDVDSAALAEIGPPSSRNYVREVGLQSTMLVPLRQAGKVVGTLGVARDLGRPPYSEDDFERLAAMAVLAP
ncbi:MAG: GAF domain-containing protein [Deltaproteobacteria bacterium]|nr:GAF domain-containing protein [Deltaproteobacteria bacterium]